MILRPRSITAYLNDVLSAMPCAVIQGARQVGKSTLAGQIAAQTPSATFTMDDTDTREAALADPEWFLAQNSDRLIVIDEIQRAPELILPIKASIDRDRRPGRFLLTGSSDLLRVQGAPDSLAGRALTVHLHGFSQGERRGRVDDFAARAHEKSAVSAFETSENRADIAEMIVAGGYPATPIPPRLRRAWFEGYLERILRLDAIDVRQSADESRLQAALRLLAANQAGELVKARLAHDAGIPATSIMRTLDVLEALYLTTSLPPWTQNLTAREASKPKALVTDSGLAAALTRVTPQILTDPLRGPLLGPLLEGFVVTELIKQRTWTATPFEMFHWRDRTGHEVDIVLEFDDGSVLALEVKSTATPRSEHFKGLRTLSEKLGPRFLGGIVICLSNRTLSFGDRLWSMPVSALWDL
ncbi:MAG: ATP-binding protein [Microbacterium gubbeenense]|uniref:ATP-binding protein n=1 Tax=Microbacterium gubbeenense TaxID=159896 RepID=UPI0004087D09|nr:DUF4143 domain-containing protein [Microbacterium gubbeenense]